MAQKKQPKKQSTSIGAPSGKTTQKRQANVKNTSKKPHAAKKKLINIDLTPFIIFSVSLISETCFLLTEQSGQVGMMVKTLFFGLFGMAMYIIPVAFLLLAFFYRDVKHMGTLRYKLMMILLSSLLLSVSATLIGQDGLAGAGFDVKQFWVSGTVCESGGVIGGVFGFILSRLLTPTVSTVLSAVALLATATFCFGKTKLGLWRVFVRGNGDGFSENENTDISVKTKPVPNVGQTKEAVKLTVPRRIDTVINSEDGCEDKPTPPPAVTRAGHRPFEDDLHDTFLDVPNGESVSSDGFRSDGTLTELEDDFEKEQNLRGSYRPKNYMDEFGLMSELEPKAAKPNIYSDEPTNAPVTPLSVPLTDRKRTGYAPKTEAVSETKSNAYSPFATLMTRDEFFEKQRSGLNRSTPECDVNTQFQSKTSEPYSFSPFADPFASMNAPKRNSENDPPQSIIATGLTREWEELHRDQARRLADEQYASEAEEHEGRFCAERPFAPDANSEPQTSFSTSQDYFVKDAPIPPQNGFVQGAPVTPQNGFVHGAPVTQQDNLAHGAPSASERSDGDSFDVRTAFPRSVPAAPAQSLTGDPVFGTAVSEPKIGMGYGDYPTAPKTSAPAKPEAPNVNGYTALGADRSKRADMSVRSDILPGAEETASSSAELDPENNPAIINPFSRYTKLRYPSYKKPPSELLDVQDESKISEVEIHETMRKILSKFESFNVEVKISGYSVGPKFTRYEIEPGRGVKVNQITALSKDIRLAVQSEYVEGDVRIAEVPGKAVIGIEVPNSVGSKVSLRSLIENPDFQRAKSKLTACLGRSVSGKAVYMDLDDMPHLLVAGRTKSGKSVSINAMIMSIIYRATPDEVQFLFIDPKQVELTVYDNIPHLVMPVIDDVKCAAGALNWAVSEMERRYTLIKNAGLRNRDEYYRFRDRNPDFEYMPQIVIVIDELADLMIQQRENVEDQINRLAAKARACGMNLIIGTQRPSTNVITGVIKGNIPSRIAFAVASQFDSRVILGTIGAENLLGYGDMLYHPSGGAQQRLQGAYVDTSEIKRVVEYLIANNGKAEFDPEILFRVKTETDKLNKSDKKSIIESDDYAVDTSDIEFDYLCQAIELFINIGKATINIIQRKLNVGFNRAKNIFEKLEELGFISKDVGNNKPRDVLIDMQSYLEWKNSNQK